MPRVSRPSSIPCLHVVLMLLRSSGPSPLVSCARDRAQAYRAIYDAVKTPRSDVNYRLSPPPRSSVRAAGTRTRVTFGPATSAPAPVDRPMDTG